MDKYKTLIEEKKNNPSGDNTDNKNNNTKYPLKIVTNLLTNNLFNYDTDPYNFWARINYEEIMRD